MKQTLLKKIIFLLILVIFCNYLKASTIFASSFGFNPANSTSSIISAMHAETDTVVVDLQSSDWNVTPLNFFNIHGKVIIFQPGVRLNAIQGAFNDTSACLLKFNFSSDIHIVGYQATFKMNKAEYAALNDSEYRHSISIRQCSNISIKGLILDESGGDGMHIGSEGLGINNNIFIEDVKFINHYRQGLSITSAQNLTVKNCYFANTQGTLPEAGIDIEPDLPTQSIVNVKIQNCAFENNGWAGIALALINLNTTSTPVSIEITNCYFKRNGKVSNSYTKCEIFLSADDINPVQGNVLFERCFIDGSDYSAIYTRKTHDAYLATFKDCVFQNVSQLQIPYNEPIFLEVPDYYNPSDYLGGLVFDNVFVSYQTDFSFFRIYGWSTLAGIKDITGSFTVVEPNNNPILYSDVNDTINCDYTFTNQTSLPISTVNLNVINNTATECSEQNASYKLERISSNICYPLGITYTNSGEVVLGDDIHLPTNGVIIPANQTTVMDSIVARQDKIIETNETIRITIQNSMFYNIGFNGSNVFDVVDCPILYTKISEDNKTPIYPNPMNNFITIENPKNQNLLIQLFNYAGQLVLSKRILSTENFNLVTLPKGMYYMHIINKNNEIQMTKKIVKQ